MGSESTAYILNIRPTGAMISQNIARASSDTKVDALNSDAGSVLHGFLFPRAGRQKQGGPLAVHARATRLRARLDGPKSAGQREQARGHRSRARAHGVGAGRAGGKSARGGPADRGTRAGGGGGGAAELAGGLAGVQGEAAVGCGRANGGTGGSFNSVLATIEGQAVVVVFGWICDLRLGLPGEASGLETSHFIFQRENTFRLCTPPSVIAKRVGEKATLKRPLKLLFCNRRELAVHG